MKYIIVGAVAGGASTAARLRRLDEHAEIVLFEKGEYISYANCGLPYYIGNVITDRNKLFVQTATSFNQRFNIDVRVQTEVLEVNAATKTINARNQKTGELYSETYDKLVLSPGAEPMRPHLPGIMSEGIFTLRNVNDTDYIKSYVNNRAIKKAVVIGAGFIGLEMAENKEDIVPIKEQQDGSVLANVELPENLDVEIEGEETEGKKDKKKKKKGSNGNVKVSQPISQGQTMNAAINSMGTTSISSLPTQQMPDFNSMYQQDNTPLVGAASPGAGFESFEPMAANAVGGGAFGSVFGGGW